MAEEVAQEAVQKEQQQQQQKKQQQQQKQEQEEDPAQRLPGAKEPLRYREALAEPLKKEGASPKDQWSSWHAAQEEKNKKVGRIHRGEGCGASGGGGAALSGAASACVQVLPVGGSAAQAGEAAAAGRSASAASAAGSAPSSRQGRVVPGPSRQHLAQHLDVDSAVVVGVAPGGHELVPSPL